MQIISVPVVGYAPPRWIPAHAAPRLAPRLGDNPMTPSAKLSFIDSPLAALLSDVAAATSIGIDRKSVV